MQTFRYTAIDNQSNPVSGKLTTVSKEQVANILREKGLIITNIEQVKEFNPFKGLQIFRGVPLMEKLIFTRQFATMISSGLPITHALKILESQAKNEIFKNALRDILSDIDGGASLQDAFSRHPNIFPRLYLSLLRAGEASGNLDEILDRLADSMQADSEFKGKIKGAMIYPALIVVLMFGVLILMMVFVIPKLTTVYKEFGVDLPITTRMIMAGSDILINFWWLIIIILIPLFVLYQRFSKTAGGREKIDSIKFNLPVFGKLLKNVQVANFTRTLGMLTASGIPILEGLDISKETLGNIHLQKGIEEVARKVEKGKSLAEPLRQDPNFPPLLAEMVAVGEQTGKIEEVLGKVADYFSADAGRTTENLASALEPIIMIVLGVVVGFLVISLVLPIYTLTSQF